MSRVELCVRAELSRSYPINKLCMCVIAMRLPTGRRKVERSKYGRVGGLSLRKKGGDAKRRQNTILSSFGLRHFATTSRNGAELWHKTATINM